MFHGSIVAIVTPMKGDGSIDYENLTRLVDWHLGEGTDGLVVLGTTGESATVRDDERAQIIEHVVGQVKGRVPVIIGTGGNATAHAIQLTKQAQTLGADAALLVTPYYNKPTQEGLFQHFGAIAKAVAIPQILYNVPSRTACDLLPETVGCLAQFSNIVAVKEATGSIDRLKELQALNLEMDLLSGDDPSSMEFMLNGGKGVITVTGNVAPKAMHDMAVAAARSDRAEAEKLNSVLQPAYKGLFAESNPIPTKWVLSEMGMIEKGIRLPLTPLSENCYEKVREAMRQANINL